jgi:hypothetical protein
MAERTAILHCRMKPDEIALMDELAEFFEADDRSTMVRIMMKDFRAKMTREKAKREKSEQSRD